MSEAFDIGGEVITIGEVREGDVVALSSSTYEDEAPYLYSVVRVTDANQYGFRSGSSIFRAHGNGEYSREIRLLHREKKPLPTEIGAIIYNVKSKGGFSDAITENFAYGIRNKPADKVWPWILIDEDGETNQVFDEHILDWTEAP